MTTVTFAAPETLVSDSNNLMMCLGTSLADGNTFASLNWQDASGGLYACSSWEATDAWLEALQAPLVRPEWDVDEDIDMAAAERAQAALVLSAEAVLASPAALTAITGMEALAAVAAMGLNPVETQDGQDTSVDP
jgi:hypothetical protein